MSCKLHSDCFFFLSLLLNNYLVLPPSPSLSLPLNNESFVRALSLSLSLPLNNESLVQVPFLSLPLNNKSLVQAPHLKSKSPVLTPALSLAALHCVYNLRRTMLLHHRIVSQLFMSITKNAVELWSVECSHGFLFYYIFLFFALGK